jgi:2-hydroxychromene-2-carboxylate isomerase
LASAPQPVFYYDLGSPTSYLVAERINSSLAVVPEWEPVPAERLEAPRVDAFEGELARVSIERIAVQDGLQPLRWPLQWPPDTRLATLAATYAKRIGRGVAFSLAAFRQTFAAGRDLGEEDTVLIAAAACEMHPAALLKAVALRATEEGLERAVARARGAGVRMLPAIQIGSLLFEGERADKLAAHVCANRASRPQ